MAVLDATIGGVAANSYLTVMEFQDYLTTAYEVTEHVDVLDDDKLLMLATRLMEAAFSPMRKLVVPNNDPNKSYYIIRPTWTGLPATSTQALLWPRTGMFTRTGVAIASNVIPNELKAATAELARQFKVGDKTIDSDISILGLTSIRAGSVALTFKDYVEATKVIPDIVFSLLVPSWLTDEMIEYANRALFDVVSE